MASTEPLKTADHGTGPAAGSAQANQGRRRLSSSSGDSTDDASKKTPLSRRCRKVALIIISPFAALILLAYFLVGWIVDRSVVVVALAWSALLALGYVLVAASGAQSIGQFVGSDASLFASSQWNSSLLAVPVVCIAGMLVVAAHRAALPRERHRNLRLALGIVHAITVLAVLVDIEARREGGGSGAQSLLVALAHVGVWFTALACGDAWVRASDVDREAAETTLLAQHVRSPWHTRTCQVSGIHSVELLRDGGGPAERPVAVGAASAEKAPSRSGKRLKTTLVMHHGYGVGAAMWCFSLDFLFEHFDNVIAIDWYGTGRSRRPKFTPRTPDDAELWFADAFETWRASHPLLSDGRQFVLLGHSLSGPIVSNYARRYPQFVEHLILLSPACVPHPPASLSRTRHWWIKFSRKAWEWASPGVLIRACGPAGRYLVQYFVRMRLSWTPESSALRTANLDDVIAYNYTNWAGKSSGERALNVMLRPGVYARGTPLCERIVPSDTVYRALPISFVYGGGRDWMSYAHGGDVVKVMKAGGARSIALYNVSGGGHQLHLNKPREVADTLAKAHRVVRKYLSGE